MNGLNSSFLKLKLKSRAVYSGHCLGSTGDPDPVTFPDPDPIPAPESDTKLD
jgi:hypothetical protein